MHLKVLGRSICPYITVDAAFTGTRGTLRPFARKDATPAQRVFNKVQSGAQMYIEQAWGMLVAKFPLWSAPVYVKGDAETWRGRVRNMIKATMILHNMCRNYKDAYPDDNADLESDDDAGGDASDDDEDIYESLSMAQREAQRDDHKGIRDILCTHLYNTFYLNDDNKIRRRA